MSTTAAAATLAVMFASAMHDGQVRIVRYGDDRLIGISELDVLVTVQAPRPQCAVSTTALQRRAVDALRASGIQVTVSDKARSSDYSLVIEVRSDGMAGTCSSALATQLVTEVSAIPEADRNLPPRSWGSLLVGAMRLAGENALVIAQDREHDSAVQKAVAAQVAALAARVRSANP